MRIFERQNGFTLIELLVVISITVILIGIVMSIASRIETQSKERQLGGTFAHLKTALEEFAIYGYQYQIRLGADPAEIDFYHSLDYPPDCNGLLLSGGVDLGLREVLAAALGVDQVNFFSVTEESRDNLTEENHKPEYSGIEAVYFFLSQVPASREVLNSINQELLTNENEKGQRMEIVLGIGGKERRYPLMRIIDPWGTSLRYDYYDEELEFTGLVPREATIKTFPVITSAGPDRRWNSGDDIESR